MTYRRRDPFHRRARAAGYRARSAYKLLELDHRFRLIRRGDFVVDLGAWPGGWLQVALQRSGPAGRIVGIDVVRPQTLGASNVCLVQGDVRDPSVVAEAVRWLGRKADVVLSDLAPKLTGIDATDQAHCAELADAALALLPTVLLPEGRFVMKLFMGADVEALAARARRQFREAKVTRPEATRRGSAEVYVVGRGYQPPET